MARGRRHCLGLRVRSGAGLPGQALSVVGSPATASRRLRRCGLRMQVSTLRGPSRRGAARRRRPETAGCRSADDPGPPRPGLEPGRLSSSSFRPCRNDPCCRDPRRRPWSTRLSSDPFHKDKRGPSTRRCADGIRSPRAERPRGQVQPFIPTAPDLPVRS
jgi:hypothetical protein